MNESFMIIDVDKYRVDVTLINESSGKLGFCRLDVNQYNGQEALARKVYEICKDLEVKKVYIDTMGIACGVYDWLNEIKQDRFEIIGLKGSRIMFESVMN